MQRRTQTAVAFAVALALAWAPAPAQAEEWPQLERPSLEWFALADCESGDWLDGGASFVYGSARWDWGAPWFEHPPWSSRLFYGGLQFDIDSWLWAREVGGHDVPRTPWAATRFEQIRVGVTLRDIHPAGWGAWPTCARLLGLM